MRIAFISCKSKHINVASHVADEDLLLLLALRMWEPIGPHPSIARSLLGAPSPRCDAGSRLPSFLDMNRAVPITPYGAKHREGRDQPQQNRALIRVPITL